VESSHTLEEMKYVWHHTRQFYIFWYLVFLQACRLGEDQLEILAFHESRLSHGTTTEPLYVHDRSSSPFWAPESSL
jgi:hypothetical protein